MTVEDGIQLVRKNLGMKTGDDAGETRSERNAQQGKRGHGETHRYAGREVGQHATDIQTEDGRTVHVGMEQKRKQVATEEAASVAKKNSPVLGD